MSLRSKSLKGGAYLTAREGVGVLVKTVGILLVTRLIGPTNYGLFAAAASIVTILGLVAWVGIDTYLLRAGEDLPDEAYDQAFTLLLITSVGLMGLGLLGAALAEGWLEDDRYIPPLQVLLLVLPVKVLWSPGQAILERGLRYRRLAALELGADALFYGTATLLAILGAGVWAPVTGFAVWQAWLLLGSFALAGYRPRLRWDRDRVRDMLRFGFAYWPTAWLGRVEELVNPFIVGLYLGPAAVGYVALALKLVDTMAFVRRITRRVGLVTLGKIQRDPARVARAIEDGLRYQVLVTGSMLVAFAYAAHWVIPTLFGEAWLPVLRVLPFLAAALLYYTVYTLPSTLLHVLDRSIIVSGALIARFLILVALSLLLVPRIGLTGYGVAAVAASVAYLPIHRAVAVSKQINYKPALIWVATFTPPLFAAMIPLPTSLVLVTPLLVLALLPWGRHQIREMVETIWVTLSGRTTSELPGNGGSTSVAGLDKERRAARGQGL